MRVYFKNVKFRKFHIFLIIMYSVNHLDNCQANSDCPPEEKCVEYVCREPSNTYNENNNGRSLNGTNKIYLFYIRGVTNSTRDLTSL